MARGKSQETRNIIEATNLILEEVEQTSSRHILYRLLSAGILSSSKQEDQLCRVLRDARIDGSISDEKFVDNRRTFHKPTVWENLTTFQNEAKHWYGRDCWAPQYLQPIIVVEKGTVGLICERVCSGLQVPLFVSSGYFSRPFLHRLADYILSVGKPVRIGYVGDFDASGLDIERAAREGNGLSGTKRREGLREILESKSVDGVASWSVLDWQRIAITESDLQTFNEVQRIPVKDGDSRAKSYIERFGYFGAEVEALPQTELFNRIQDFVNGFKDERLWEESQQLEAEDQAKLSELQ